MTALNAFKALTVSTSQVEGLEEALASSAFGEADSRGIVPDSDDDQGALIQQYLTDMGDDGTVFLRPGHYKLGAPLLVNKTNQTLFVAGVVFDDTIVFEKLGTTIVGTLTIDGQYRSDGGPWHGVIDRFLQETERSVRVHNIKGVAYVGGGTFRPNAARGGALSIYAAHVGMVGSISCGNSGLLMHAITGLGEDLSSIQSGGSGYRDGTFIGRTRTLTGSGEGAIIGVKVESGAVVEATVIDSGEGYAKGDTFTLDFPGYCRASDLSSMNTNYDAAWTAYHDAIETASGDLEDTAVIAAKATFDSEATTEVGSGFVMVAGDVIENGYYWNSNFNVTIMANGAYFAGWETRGKANYNQYNMYLEDVHSREMPSLIDRNSADNDWYLNVLVNQNTVRPIDEGVKLVDFSGAAGVKINGGRSGNPYVFSTNYDDWFSEIILLGSSWKSIQMTAFSGNTQDRSVFRVNNLMFKSSDSAPMLWVDNEPSLPSGTVRIRNGIPYSLSEDKTIDGGVVADSAERTGGTYQAFTVVQQADNGNYYIWDGSAWAGSGTRPTAAGDSLIDPLSPTLDWLPVTSALWVQGEAGLPSGTIRIKNGTAYRLASNIATDYPDVADSAERTGGSYPAWSIVKQTDNGRYYLWDGEAWEAYITKPVIDGDSTADPETDTAHWIDMQSEAIAAFIANAPEYADDTAAGAGGLTEGDLYVTTSGAVMRKGA